VLLPDTMVIRMAAIVAKPGIAMVLVFFWSRWLSVLSISVLVSEMMGVVVVAIPLL